MPQVCIYFIVSFCIRKQLLICYRKLLSSSLLAVETYFKGAIQGYVVTILIRVIDKVQKYSKLIVLVTVLKIQIVLVLSTL